MTESDFRALCAEQMADGPAVPEGREPASVVGDPSNRTRRVCIWSPTQMAECGGPCWEARDPSACDCGALWMDVPEGREPASVDGDPSDENCWRWYTYCPEEGIETHFDKKQAQSAAQSIMDSYEVAAHSDGWHEDMESVSWGMLVPVEQAQVVERKTAEPDDEFGEWVKYELRPARYSHQPAPPAEGDVAKLVKWLKSRAGIHASHDFPAVAAKLTRAADLLEQRYPAPVPAAIETTYEFCVYDENYIAQAGGTAPTYAQALSEGRHYLAQYQQDGPHTLELRRIERLPLPAEEVMQ